MSFIEKMTSDAYVIKWKDSGNLIINMTEIGESSLQVTYQNGRGTFDGTYTMLDNNFIFQIDFTDGQNPDAGKQVGVLDFNGEVIYWGNDTKWTYVE